MMAMQACKNAETEKEQAEETEQVNDEQRQRFFQIPAPTELFELLKLEGIKPGKQINLNPIGNLSKYNDSQSKALNFGVYTTNLLFCSAFNQKTEVLKYFENLKQLAEDIGISNVITEQTLTRIEKNLNNNDSLDVITNDVFFEASDNLERQGKQDVLILVVTGSWIEGVYLATQMADKFNSENEIMQRIAEQKFSLENLIDYYNTIPNAESLEEVKNKLVSLMDAFESITEVQIEANANPENGKTIGAGSELRITENQYVEISKMIANLRAFITKQ